MENQSTSKAETNKLTEYYILLIIDDNKSETEIICDALDQVGIACVSAWADIKERVFKVLSQVTPDFIIMDLRVSKMNSFDVMGEIKSSGKSSEIPLILYGEPIAEELMNKAKSSGACAFVQKTNDSNLMGEGFKSAFRENDLFYINKKLQEI